METLSHHLLLPRTGRPWLPLAITAPSGSKRLNGTCPAPRPRRPAVGVR
uniref:Uncharacterized protein n=1 Tax=Setaria italica TaxID=4555 RepID=A0A0Q3QEE4_SETIT